MIKINDEFSFEQVAYSWELYQRVPSDHHKSKGGYKIKTTYYPTLEMMLLNAVDKSLDSCTELQEILDKIITAKKEIKESIKQYELLRKSKPVD